MINTNLKKALLVIDIQENLVSSASRIHIDITHIDQFFRNVNNTIGLFEGANLPVLYITNEWTNLLVNWVTGNACKKGGKGVGPAARLRLANHRLYKKSTKSAFSNTDLLKDLQHWKVSEVVLIGLFAEHCVKATLLDALRNHLKVTVITDALGSKNDKALSRALAFYGRKGATLVSSDEIKNGSKHEINL